MYFKQFPQIYYDFPQVGKSDVDLQILTDITTNVRFRKEVLENITLYDEYDMLEGETPEMVAEKVYGNPELHWIIMLVNQRYDYLRDFPLTSAELEEYCIRTYGADNIYNVHHYEKDNLVVEGIATIKVPAKDINEFKVHDFIVNEPYANARVESIDVANKTVTVMLDYGTFSAGQLVTLKGIRTDESGKVIYTAVLNFQIPNNGFSLNDNYKAITNYAYENIQNEKKRRIKLISSSLVDQIVREFQKLMK